ncbi:MAG TPA: sugar transferase [Syntrophorhabdaceae bacterium]|mgnify:CR=1 FL=1|nr:sugar transferase [Syntrophorhabdaceae bacterium]HQM82294.1 sugar transferase [Syntrophorhabdaceae bacterium]
MKRLFDLVVSLLFIVLLFPVILFTGLLVLVSMGRPVLFRQVRPGYKGRPFTIYKFRTMTEDRDKTGAQLTDEERLTGAGRFLRRFSLDELPQLFNVVKGELSFVGPRPLLMEYVPLYTKEQARRHDVKPGITGLAQVRGRNAITWEERFALDIYYVDHRGFWLDMKILVDTVLAVIRKEGISAEGCETMPKFTGSKPDKEKV